MIKRALVALIACLAIAAVVAGCGGGDDSTSGGDESADSGAAPTKAAFVKEADAICQSADNELGGEIETYEEDNGISTKGEPSKAEQEEIYEQVVLPNVGKQGEEIDALTAPEGDEVEVGEIVEALNRGVEEGEADPALLVEGKSPLAEASSKARAYGMTVCGSE